MSAIVSCIVITVLVSIGLGVGIGYHYSYVDMKTLKLERAQEFGTSATKSVHNIRALNSEAGLTPLYEDGAKADLLLDSSTDSTNEQMLDSGPDRRKKFTDITTTSPSNKPSDTQSDLAQKHSSTFAIPVIPSVPSTPATVGIATEKSPSSLADTSSNENDEMTHESEPERSTIGECLISICKQLELKNNF